MFRFALIQNANTVLANVSVRNENSMRISCTLIHFHIKEFMDRRILAVKMQNCISAYRRQ